MLSFATVKFFAIVLLSTFFITNVCAAGLGAARQANEDSLQLRDMTNAQRFARGLPPKKPNIYRRGGKKLGSPSHVFTSRPYRTKTSDHPTAFAHSTPIGTLPKLSHLSSISHLSHLTPPTPPFSHITSTAPASKHLESEVPTQTSFPAAVAVSKSSCVSYQGLIEVSSQDGSLNGYLSDAGPKGLYSYTQDLDNTLHVNFGVCGNEPFQVTAAKPLSKRASVNMLGGIQDPRGTCIWLGSVPPTPPGSAPHDLPNSLTDALNTTSSGVESSIWTMSGDGVLSVTWITDANNTPTTSTTISYVSEMGAFTFVGVPQDGANGGQCIGTDVTFTFVPE